MELLRVAVIIPLLEDRFNKNKKDFYMKWEDLNTQNRAELIKLYVRNGVTSLDRMKEHYNSFGEGGSLGKKKPEYKEWVKGVDKRFLSDDYNLEAAYNELDFAKMEAWRRNPSTYHLPDTYKLPNHITFSEESIDPIANMRGGRWVGDKFYPSEVNRMFHPNVYKYKGVPYVEVPYSERGMLPAEMPEFNGGIKFGEEGHLFAGGGSPDWDPTHPYHYHNDKGEKVVMEPEVWEANVGQPYFKNIEDAVNAERAAHPGPEYEEVENPEYVDFKNKYYQRVVPNFNVKLPEGYYYKDNMITDDNGNVYIQSSQAFRDGKPRYTIIGEQPAFSAKTSQPHGWYDQDFYQIEVPQRTKLIEKKPLKVDKVVNKNDFEDIKKKVTEKKRITYLDYFVIHEMPPFNQLPLFPNINQIKKMGYRAIRPGDYALLVGFDDEQLLDWKKKAKEYGLNYLRSREFPLWGNQSGGQNPHYSWDEFMDDNWLNDPKWHNVINNYRPQDSFQRRYETSNSLIPLFKEGGHLFADGGSPLTKAISNYIGSGKSFDDILSENAMFARNFSPEQIEYARKWYNEAKMKPRKKSKEELDWEWERGRTREQREYRNNQLSKLAEQEKRAGTNPLLWPIETNVTPYEAAKKAMPNVNIPTQSQQKAHQGEIRDWYKYSPSQQAGMQNALLGANNAYAMTPDLTYNTYTATGQVYKDAAEMGLLFAGLPYAGKVIDAVGNPTTTIIKAGSKILPNAEKLLGIANDVDRTYNGYLTYDGIRNLVSDNGVQKTYKLMKQRDYGKAFKSGAGDVLDIFGSVPINYLKYLKGMRDFRINESNKIINEIEDFAEAFNNSNRPATMNSYFRPSKLKIGEIVTPKKFKDMGYDLMGFEGINDKGYYYIPSYRPGDFMRYGTKERGVLAKKGLIGHEQQHSWQPKSNILDENSPFPLTRKDLSESYYFFANPEHPLYKSSLHYLDKNKQKAGWKELFFPKSWKGSPGEVDSEMMRFRVMLDKDNDIYKNIQYYKWPKELKEKAIKQISKRFSLKPRETTKLLYDMSTFGYF